MSLWDMGEWEGLGRVVDVDGHDDDMVDSKKNLAPSEG
jgi:hypothetical protein